MQEYKLLFLLFFTCYSIALRDDLLQIIYLPARITWNKPFWIGVAFVSGMDTIAQFANRCKEPLVVEPLELSISLEYAF